MILYARRITRVRKSCTPHKYSQSDGRTRRCVCVMCGEYDSENRGENRRSVLFHISFHRTVDYISW